MTGSPLACAVSISCRMYSRATQLSSPHEVRQRLIDSRMGSGRSPQNAQLTSITRSAGRFPNPALAPNPPAANTALSRSVRNLSQIRSFIDGTPCVDKDKGVRLLPLTPELAAHLGKLRRGFERPVGVDADARACPTHARLSARL